MTNAKTAAQKFERPIKVDDVLVYDGQVIIIDSIELEDSFTQRKGKIHFSYVKPDGSVLRTNSGELRPRYDGDKKTPCISDMEAAAVLRFLDVEAVDRVVVMPANLEGIKFTTALDAAKREVGDERHPSYGIVQVTRPSGGSGKMFGSELNHSYYMSISIHRAYRKRDLNADHIFHDMDSIAEVHLTEVQWARMVSSAGNGSGTPCTLNTVMGVHQGEPPDQERLHILDKEAAAAGRRASKTMDSLVAKLEGLLAGKSFTKKDLAEVLAAAQSTKRDLGPNLEYAIDMAREAVETVVEEGKAEVEAFVNQTAQRLGFAQLAGAPQLLLGSKASRNGEKTVNALPSSSEPLSGTDLTSR